RTTSASKEHPYRGGRPVASRPFFVVKLGGMASQLVVAIRYIVVFIDTFPIKRFMDQFDC
ncbi:MAG: hypothetical protein Q8O19_07320, partial [Rectinemataceae bacterium]|nr:hypothetical protein [Rectinemataceae bacterium]